MSLRRNLSLGSFYQGTNIGSMDHSWKVKSQSSIRFDIISEDSSVLSGPYSLPYTYAALYASCLEDALTQMRILSETRSELHIMKAKADMPKLLAQKYSIRQPAIEDELEGIKPQDLWREEYKLDKLARDREFLKDTLLSTYLDLVNNRSFQFLVDHNDEADEKNNRRSSLVTEEAKNLILGRETAKQLRVQRNHHKAVSYDVNANIDTLQQRIEDACLNAEARTRYVTSWERSRTEQHVMKIADKETPPLENIMTYKRKLDDEHRTHSEVTLLNNIQINEALEAVEKIMSKYERDIEEIDLKIQRMRSSHEDMYNRRIQLEETISKHDKLMKDWVKYKDDREKARQYRIKMTNAAITVQAWWRGLLVRNQLGPYKPAKKPKGKKK